MPAKKAKNQTGLRSKTPPCKRHRKLKKTARAAHALTREIPAQKLNHTDKARAANTPTARTAKNQPQPPG
ncbi:hypothetical protein PTKU46_16250 [Paraburkholderia terrae]